MKQVRITAKPKRDDNHIMVKLAQEPQLVLEGTVLCGLRMEKERERTQVRTAVEIPASVDTIDSVAFQSWDPLEHICFGKTAFRLGAGVFSDCLYLKTAVLAEGTEKIPMSAFSGCSSLRKVQLPGTVTRINMNAFKNCTALEAMDFPAALETIEASAFWGCRGLTELCLPDHLRVLGEDAFGSCTDLRQVRLPESLLEIGSCAFHNCIALGEVVIPEGIRSLPDGVFAGCKNLKRVVLPGTLEKIHPYAFYKCDNLGRIDHPEPEKFKDALRDTPFWRKRNPGETCESRLPMELLNKYAGAVSGCILSAMGHHWFDLDREYRFFLTKFPGVIEVRTRYPDDKEPKCYYNDYFLMTESLEPIPGIPPIHRCLDSDVSRIKDLWNMHKDTAARIVERQRKGQ